MSFNSIRWTLDSPNSNFQSNTDVSSQFLRLRRNVCVVPVSASTSIYTHLSSVGLLIEDDDGNLIQKNSSYRKLTKIVDYLPGSSGIADMYYSDVFSIYYISNKNNNSDNTYIFKAVTFKPKFIEDYGLVFGDEVLKFTGFLNGTTNYKTYQKYEPFVSIAENYKGLKFLFPTLEEDIGKRVLKFSKKHKLYGINTVKSLEDLYKFISIDRYKFGLYSLMCDKAQKVIDYIKEGTKNTVDKVGFSVKTKVSYNKFVDTNKNIPKFIMNEIRWSENLLKDKDYVDIYTKLNTIYTTYNTLSLKDKGASGATYTPIRITGLYTLDGNESLGLLSLINTLNRKEEQYLTILIELYALLRDINSILDKKYAVLAFKGYVLESKGDDTVTSRPLQKIVEDRGSVNNRPDIFFKKIRKDREDLFSSDGVIRPINSQSLSVEQEKYLDSITEKLGFTVRRIDDDTIEITFNKPIIPTKITVTNARITTLTVTEMETLARLFPDYFPDTLVISCLNQETPDLSFRKIDERASKLGTIHPNVSGDKSICSGGSYTNLEEKIYAIFNFAYPSGFKKQPTAFKKLLVESGDATLVALGRRIGRKGKN